MMPSLQTTRGYLWRLQWRIHRIGDLRLSREIFKPNSIDALIQGRLEDAESLLGTGAQIEAGTVTLIASLQLTELCKLLAFHFLLEKGVDFRETDGEGRTALHHVARFGQLDVFKWLLQKGQDPAYENQFQKGVELGKQDNWRYTALHEAVECPHMSAEAIHEWVAVGGPLDDVTNKNETALSIACQKLRLDKAIILTEAGAAIGIQNEERYAELAFAIRAGIPKEHPSLLEQIDPIENGELKAGFSEFAVKMIGRLEDIDTPIAGNQSPLVYVIRQKRINDRNLEGNSAPLLNALLARNPDVNAVDTVGDTIFIVAAKRGDLHFFEDYVLTGLTQNGNLAAMSPRDGMNAAQIADERGHPAIAKILSERAATA